MQLQQQPDSPFGKKGTIAVSSILDPSHGVLCGLGNRIGVVSGFILCCFEELGGFVQP